MAKRVEFAAGRKKKTDAFDIVNYIVFILIGLIVLVPIWKVVVDSFNAVGVYKFQLFPNEPTLDGYRTIIHTSKLYQPFVNSVVTTILGTLLGLVMSTLGGYVLSQYDMPGRNALAYFLLFTMIFSGGMIPEYLVMKQLGLVNKMWILVVKHGMNVYNLVLMRNFFEGIPESLFEAAQIDGCSPMGIFFKIVLPLSKAALASIGLMFSVSFWNDYTNFKLYISKNNLYNFQIRLRSMVADSDIPNDSSVSPETISSAATIVAVLPFVVIYPFCQKYFVQGVNVGAVKE
jgi:putative aldouronate transport system permease protein